MKKLFWIASSKVDLLALPAEVIAEIGYALHLAQMGDKHKDTKPLKGFGNAGVLEIVESYDGNAYRAIYTLRYIGAVFVLHVFQKKSKSGVSTPAKEIEKIKSRLRKAELEYEKWLLEK